MCRIPPIRRTVLALSLLFAAGASPATRPLPLGRWLAQLADPEPDVRTNALIALKGLSPADLPALHDAAAVRPLGPAQADGLKEAVIYVLMHAALRELADHGAPFIGIRYAVLADERESDDAPRPLGVIVNEVLPGLPAARSLQPGDLNLGADVERNGQHGLVWITDRTDMAILVGQCPPGESLNLRVRRAGRETTIGVTPEPRPRFAGEAINDDAVQLENAIAQARLDAGTAFEERFGKLAGMTPPGGVPHSQ